MSDRQTTLPGETRMCDEYCRYARYCIYHKDLWAVGKNPEECCQYYYIEDLLWDAECDRREYRHDDDPEEEYVEEED